MKEAQRRRVSKQVQDLRSIRAAMWAEHGDFMRIVNSLEFELAQLEGRIERIRRSNWDDLKQLKRG